MSKVFQPITETLYRDLLSVSLRETPIQAALREETTVHVEQHQMMTTPDQVQCLSFLVSLISARRAIEVGVFTGYASLAIAMALPEDGMLVACDHGDEWPSIGKPYWEKAGVADKIDLQIRPALQTLQQLIDAGQEGQYDFVFIDADKVHYSDYFDASFRLLRSGGLIVLDNVLMVGSDRVSDQKTPATRAIHTLLERLHQDQSISISLLPVAQGMLLVRKV